MAQCRSSVSTSRVGHVDGFRDKGFLRNAGPARQITKSRSNVDVTQEERDTSESALLHGGGMKVNSSRHGLSSNTASILNLPPACTAEVSVFRSLFPAKRVYLLYYRRHGLPKRYTKVNYPQFW